MSGVQKRPVKKYYEQPTTNRRGGIPLVSRGGKKKYINFENDRDYEYQYVQKERKKYSREEMMKLKDNYDMPDHYLDDLVSKYDFLFLRELQALVPEAEVDPDAYQETFIFNNDREKRKRYQEKDGQDGDGKEFERFDFGESELTSEDFEQADKILEKKYNESRQESEDMPEWANEDYDDDLPLWGDTDIAEVKKETENTEEWTKKFVKTLNKDEVQEKSESSESYDDDSDDDYSDRKKTSFTEEDIHNLPNILNMMKQSTQNQQVQQPAPVKQTNAIDLQSQLLNFVADSQAAKKQQSQQNSNIQQTNLSAPTGQQVPQNNQRGLNSMVNQLLFEQPAQSAPKQQFEQGSTNFDGLLNMFSQNPQVKIVGNQAPAQNLMQNINHITPQQNYQMQNQTMPQQNNLLNQLFSTQPQPQVPQNHQEDHGQNDQANQENKFSKLFDGRNNRGGNFGNFSGLNAFLDNSEEGGSSSEDSGSESEDKQEPQAITNIVVGPPPPISSKNAHPPTVEEIELEKNKKEFHEKYFVMDRVLSQVVYDTLNSKRRQAINMNSVNGINQSTAENYCDNNYKIFSFLMQGDLFSKIWNYKDKLGNVQGPFMSFDMDIWNGEGNYFSKNLQISPNNKDYFPLSMYIEREPKILDLMQETVQKNEEKFDNPMMMPMMMGKRNNQNMSQGQQGQPQMMQPGQQPQGPNPYVFMNTNYHGKGNKKGGHNNRGYQNNQQGGKFNRGGANQRVPYQNNRGGRGGAMNMQYFPQGPMGQNMNQQQIFRGPNGMPMKGMLPNGMPMNMMGMNPNMLQQLGPQAEGLNNNLGLGNLQPDAATQNLKDILGIGMGMLPQGTPVPLDAIFGIQNPNAGSGQGQFQGESDGVRAEDPKLQQSDFPSLGDGLSK